MIFVFALACGIALGYALGGRVRNLANVPHRLLLLLWISVALQIGLTLVPGSLDRVEVRFSIVLVSYFLIAVWLLVNLRDPRMPRAGVVLIASGWFLNLLVIAANGGMPVSRAALRRAGQDPHIDVAEGHLFKHVPADDDTSLYALADVIPVRPIGNVISIGDIVLILGLIVFIASAMAISPDPRTSTSRFMDKRSVQESRR